MRKPVLSLPLRILFVLISLLPSGCDRRSPSAPPPVVKPSPAPPTVPASKPTPGNAGPQFREVGEAAGLHYQWKIEGKRPLTILQTIGNGCAFLDYDNDGNLDILLVGPKLALYKGDGKGHFTDVTAATGLDKLSGHFLGCAVGDYDNDGYDDLYISGWRTGLLLHNEAGEPENKEAGKPGNEDKESEGKGNASPSRVFRDVTGAMGLKPQPWGSSCGFADLDGDGYLDLYVANYIQFGPESEQLCPYHGVLTSCGPNGYDPIKGVLYHNEGGRRFRDVTRAWKVDAHGKGLAVAFADFNRSGRVSLAIANDLVPGDFFQNMGRGKFKNIAAEVGTAMDEAGEAHAGMGVDWGDYDNDGNLDMFVTTFGNEMKSLYRNDGHGLFSIVSDRVGIERPTLPYVAWGCKFLDADNDGWLDLLVANGHVQDNIQRFEKMTYRQPLVFLHNKGGRIPVFEDATKSSGIGRLPRVVGRGVAIGDYDNDGRVDALVVDSEGRPLLLHNETPSSPEGWVGFRLIGQEKSNRDAYGAVLTIRVGAQRRMRQCQPSGSYLSSSDARVHFGLGAEKLQSLTITWPDGTVETWTDLEAGRYYMVKQGARPQ